MRTFDDQSPIRWRLRELMAGAGMFHTTDLVGPLREVGIQLSREQVFRLVTKTPARLNVDVLAGLCQILSCTPNDLIQIKPARTIEAGRRTGTTDASGPEGHSIGDLRPVPARIRRPT
jgi:DNA-binding Xre family transcriptional regulator